MKFKKTIIGMVSFLLILVASTYLFLDPAIESIIENAKIDKEGKFKIKMKSLHLSLLTQKIKIQDFELWHADQKVVTSHEVKSTLSLTELIDRKIKLKLKAYETVIKPAPGMFKTLREIVKRSEASPLENQKFKLDLDWEAFDLKFSNRLDLIKFAGIFKGKIDDKKLKSFKGDLTLLTHAQSKLALHTNGTYRDFILTGTLTKLTQDDLEKVMNKKFPIEIKQGYLDAALKAHSQDLVIKGTLTPELNDIKIKIDEDKSFLQRIGSKIVNKVFEKGDVEVSTTIPFIFEDDLVFDLDQGVKGLKKNK